MPAKKKSKKPEKSPRKEEAYANKYRAGARAGKTTAGTYLNSESSQEAHRTANANRSFKKAVDEISKPKGGSDSKVSWEKSDFKYHSNMSGISKDAKSKWKDIVKKRRLSKKESDYVKSMRKKK